jgi:hypothetical protein
MLRSLFVRLFLPLLAALALLGPVSAAHAARGMEMAIEDEDAFVDQKYGPRDAVLAAAEQLGVTRMRILVQWSRVSDASQSSPSSDADYYWGPIDDTIDAAAGYGIRIQLTLTGPAPVYASGNHRIGFPVVKPNPARYADFAHAAAAHFKGRVDRYVIWNEPNLPAWLAPNRQSPKLYRALYQAGYSAIKSADPTARVFIGETVPYDDPGTATAPLKWLRAVACVNARYKRIGGCKPLKADGYAHHPYEFLHKPSYHYPGNDNAPIGSLSRLRVALNKLARAHALSTPRGRPLDIYLTEFGYFVSGKREVPATKRAKWLPQAFTIAERQPRVREMVQYNVVAPPPALSQFTTGLVNPSGSPLPEFPRLVLWTRTALRRGGIKRSGGPLTLPERPGGLPTTPPTTIPPPTGTGSGGGSGSGGGTTVPPPPPPSSSGDGSGSSGGGGSSPPSDGGGSTPPPSDGGGSTPPPSGGGGGGGICIPIPPIITCP